MKKNKQENKMGSLLSVAHEMAKGLYKVGAIDAITMREFDEDCLPPVEKLKPKQIKSLRLREKVSQAVFAKLLNVSLSSVRQWEQGDKTPQGAALKLLNIVLDNGIKILGYSA